MNILTNLQKNEEEALKIAFNKYYNPLFSYLFNKTKSVDCTEDIIQITFIKLWQSRQKLNPNVDLNYQIFRIARTTMIDELRKINTTKKVKEYIWKKEMYSEEITQNILYKDTLAKLENIVQLLPPIRRRVFFLSRFANYSHKEIAEQLSISTRTVENHITLAIKFIRPFFSVIMALGAAVA